VLNQSNDVLGQKPSDGSPATEDALAAGEVLVQGLSECIFDAVLDSII
jgi:hypothetical protein